MAKKEHCIYILNEKTCDIAGKVQIFRSPIGGDGVVGGGGGEGRGEQEKK